MKRNAIVLVLLGIVIGVAVFAARPDMLDRIRLHAGLMSQDEAELTPFYHRILRYHRRISGNALPGSVHFIGDSFIQGLCVSAVTAPAINFGIGGDTSYGVLRRISQYPSLRTASAVVLAFGFNDLWFRSPVEVAANYRQVLRAIPAQTPVVMTAVFPVDDRVEPALAGMNARVDELNRELERLCAERQYCAWVDIGDALRDDSGRLAARYGDGDGLHLSSAGNAIWIAALRPLLN